MKLQVTNGYRTTLAGLARNKSLMKLSEKRITKATREALRAKYGEGEIQVSCKAESSSGAWTGKCVIQGVRHKYSVQDSIAGTENYLSRHQ